MCWSRLACADEINKERDGGRSSYGSAGAYDDTRVQRAIAIAAGASAIGSRLRSLRRLLHELARGISAPTRDCVVALGAVVALTPRVGKILCRGCGGCMGGTGG